MYKVGITTWYNPGVECKTIRAVLNEETIAVPVLELQYCSVPKHVNNSVSKCITAISKPFEIETGKLFCTVLEDLKFSFLEVVVPACSPEPPHTAQSW